MYIIIGLGNPGTKYANTRHNMGFKAIDSIAGSLSADVSKSKFKALIGETNISGKKVLLVKPQTFMNLSGESAREVVNFYKVPNDHIIVIYDDIDLPLGSIRIRKGGGPGGHNGMKSMINCLGFKDFPRIRIGVGSNKGENLIDHVIGKVSSNEQKALNESADAAANAAIDIVKVGIDNAMNVHNVRKSAESND